MSDTSLYDIIHKIIIEETQYYKHYIGQVVGTVDIIKRGRVSVAIKELGFERPDQGIWCYPRQGHGMSVPAMGDWVEVYFINADSSRPVYLFPATEVPNMTPASYNGLPTTHVLWESPMVPADNIVFDELLKSLTMLSGVEPAVLGTQLMTFLTTFITTIFNLHTHICAAPAAPSGPPVPVGTPPPATINSLFIKVK